MRKVLTILAVLGLLGLAGCCFEGYHDADSYDGYYLKGAPQEVQPVVWDAPAGTERGGAASGE
jgi:hypothetical protein